MTVTLTSGDSPFFDTLGLYDKGGKLAYTLGTNKDQYGKQVKLNANQLSSAGYRSGDELIFGIDVKNTKKRYFTGQADRNPDKTCHANVVALSGGTFKVGFEDSLMPGSDLDYNDFTWTVSNLCQSCKTRTTTTEFTLPVSVHTSAKVSCL